MNDITKARYYLHARGSSWQHLTSFGLMLATAEAAYRRLRLNHKGVSAWDTLEHKEVEVALDYAVLRYMSRHNRLPDNVTDAFAPGVTLEDKKQLAMGWISA